MDNNSKIGKKRSMAGKKKKRSEFGESNYRPGSTYPGNSYYRRKRKQEKEKKKRAAIAIAAVLLVLVLLGGGIKKWLRTNNPNLQNGAESAAEELVLKSAVTINDVDITGLSREEAERAVLSKYHWNMRAKPELLSEIGESYLLSDLLKLKLEKILDEVYASAAPEKDLFVLNSEGMDVEIAAEVSEMRERWNRAPKNGAIESYDKEKQRFLYSEAEDGYMVDEASAILAIRTAMNERNYDSLLSIKMDMISPELTAEQAEERYRVIGTFTTEATQNADRNNNLKLACEAIDGKILQVGEEFSFNLTTGNRTIERGYKPAGAYQNGKVVLEPGGGVCQISSTLYNAVIRSGITPTERHSHTFEPSYVTPGEDATVSYDGYEGPDMKFVNTTASALALRATFRDRTVTISLIGIPVLQEGVTVSLNSVRTEEYDNGGVEYIEDTTVQPGEEKQISEGSMGSRWVTNLVMKKDGTVISDSFFHNSTYKGHSRKIARNTSGTVTENEDPDALVITENTETAPEQASSEATEGGVVAPAGPGAPGSASKLSGPGEAASKPKVEIGPEKPKPEGPATTPKPGETISPKNHMKQEETVAPFSGN